MSKVLEFLETNNLMWQPSLRGDIGEGLFGYRGAVVIIEGKVLSESKVLPPKATGKQAIIVMDDEKIKFFSAEIESVDHIGPFLEKYGEFFASDAAIFLYVIDLSKDVLFKVGELTVQAKVLDESSVWNELLDVADLEKSDLKKLNNQAKILKVYEEVKDVVLPLKEISFDELESLKSGEGKTLFGAV